MKSQASLSTIRLVMLTVMRKEMLMATYYIGADVHSNNTELAVEQKGKLVARYSVPTTIPAIGTVLDSVQGRKLFAMEEGPMAGWLYRNLHEKVDQFIVSEPRRNKLITCEGDKDDKIDARKLAVLLRGEFLKAVHHTDDSDRAHLKHWVNLYHDRVRDAVRYINKIRACCRMHGIAIPRKVVRNNVHRLDWLSGLDNPVLKAQLQMLWIGYDATKEQVQIARKQLSSAARKHRIIKHWCKLPGIRLIRAATIFAYLDTPWRFKNRAKLHKYCGVGLVRATSGKDKQGRPKPARLKLPWAVNRRLKNAVLGAATSAITRHSNNAFKDYYERMLSNGITPANARHSVARKMMSVMSAMWKTDSAFDPRLL
jgi:transposase